MSFKVVIVQSGFLGDAVLASGMLRMIASAHPAWEIGFLVRAEYASLFERHPALSRLHRFEKKRKGGMEEMTVELRDAGYDAALLPHRSARSAMLVRRAGIRRRIGFRQSDAPWLLTDRVEYRIALHETDRNASLLGRLGVESAVADRLPWLVPPLDAVASMRDRFDDGRPIVLLAPGSVWATKRWRESGYAGVAESLRREGKHVILIGSSGERELCDRIAMAAGMGEEDIACGILALPEVLALISIARRVITNDSAPLHLAESVATPVTAIFGPTVPEFGFGPLRPHSNVVERRDLPCRPCGIHGSERCPIGTHECMEVGINDEL
jgi:heptosyltransferase-2